VFAERPSASVSRRLALGNAHAIAGSKIRHPFRRLGRGLAEPGLLRFPVHSIASPSIRSRRDLGAIYGRVDRKTRLGAAAHLEQGKNGLGRGEKFRKLREVAATELTPMITSATVPGCRGPSSTNSARPAACKRAKKPRGRHRKSLTDRPAVSKWPLRRDAIISTEKPDQSNAMVIQRIELLRFGKPFFGSASSRSLGPGKIFWTARNRSPCRGTGGDRSGNDGKSTGKNYCERARLARAGPTALLDFFMGSPAIGP